MKKKMRKQWLCTLLAVLMILSMLPIATVTASAASSDALEMLGATIRYEDATGSRTGEKAAGLRFAARIDKTARTYLNAVREGNYDPTNESVKFGVLILPTDMMPSDGNLTVDTPDVEKAIFDKVYAQTDSELHFTVSLLGIPAEDFARGFTARVFMQVTRNGETRYTYSENTLSRSFVGVGNIFYEDNRANESLCARIDEIFANCAEYQGKNIKTITFTLFSDLHYWEGWYIASIADLESIMKRANDSNSDFVMQAGDFTNDVSGSPELYKTYLQNEYGLPAYGVYGNHEMEQGDSMATVTPTLTNDKNVVWGTADGKIGDGSIGYYYFDYNGFRMICLDSMYSWDPTTEQWEHNRTGSYSYASGNEKGYSLGPVQLAWLEDVLDDAVEKELSCVVTSHRGFAISYSDSPDGEAVRELYKKANEKRAGTVLMSISGHLHTNHTEVIDNVLHLDMNTVRNGGYKVGGTAHYTNQEFEYTIYDINGNALSTSTQKIRFLRHVNDTWFFADPLSAVVTVSTTGKITIEGSESEWIDGIAPSWKASGMEPKVDSGVFELQLY